MDYNEMAIHFDKMVRKHNVLKVLNQARRLYQDYLRYHKEKAKHAKR
jgi:TBC1 domain family member 25